MIGDRFRDSRDSYVIGTGMAREDRSRLPDDLAINHSNRPLVRCARDAHGYDLMDPTLSGFVIRICSMELLPSYVARIALETAPPSVAEICRVIFISAAKGG